jgi:alpha-galactosidase
MNLVNQFLDCYWHWQGDRLIVGNDRLERSWIFTSEGPVAHSLINKDNGTSWISPGSIPGFAIAPSSFGPALEDFQTIADIDDDIGIGASCLKINVQWPSAQLDFRWTLRLYPAEAFIRQEMAVKRNSCSAEHSGSRTDELEAGAADANSHREIIVPSDRLDLLQLVKRHVRFTAVMFEDQTDYNNNLVHKRSGLIYPNEQRGLQGNLLLLEDTITSNGLWILKESPAPVAHLNYPGEDFRWMGHTLIVTGTGLSLQELSDTDYYPAYGCCVGVYDGSEDGALHAIDRYHHCMRVYVPERDAVILSNTWGDRNRDGRIRESFVLEEIRKASQLGITCVQIDDGWQVGKTINSIHPGGRWGSYYADKDTIGFWEVDLDKFPQGLSPIAAEASQHGISLGLWFAPDFEDDYAHWEQDAASLIELHNRYDIRHFKLDGNKIRSKLGELRLADMMRTVHRATNGKIIFNMDATADIRLGYFRNTQYGNIFLENRYTDWHNYYPHFTLRNLWQLSAYVPARQLQIEFLNVERNREVYDIDDPLSPTACGIAYSFAVAMFSCPLAWMELTGLSSTSCEELRPLIRQYGTIQAHLLGGHIMPIGEEPDGTSWTGFQSATGENEGYVLLLRELTANEHGVYRLRGQVTGNIKLNLLLCSKEINADATWDTESQQINVCLKQPCSFALYRYCSVKL